MADDIKTGRGPRDERLFADYIPPNPAELWKIYLQRSLASGREEFDVRLRTQAYLMAAPEPRKAMRIRNGIFRTDEFKFYPDGLETIGGDFNRMESLGLMKYFAEPVVAEIDEMRKKREIRKKVTGSSLLGSMVEVTIGATYAGNLVASYLNKIYGRVQVIPENGSQSARVIPVIRSLLASNQGPTLG